MDYVWILGWLLVTLQVLIVGVFVIWIALSTRSTLDIKVGPASPRPARGNTIES